MCLHNKTEKIGTSEMSNKLTSNFYPIPFLNGVNIGIANPSTTIYGHSFFFF